jgi:TP901-1 family phage major tail protein
MAATRGKDFLLKRWDGAAYQTIGGLRSTGMTINNEQIDVTNKSGSTDWRQMITGGVQSVSISGGGVFTNGTHERAFYTAASANTLNNYRIIDSNGNYLQGQFQITSYGQSGEYTGALEYTATLESSGDITLTLV